MRKIIFTIVFTFMFTLGFTGCSTKGTANAYYIPDEYVAPQNQKFLFTKKENPSLYFVMGSRSGGPKLSREAMRKESVTALFQAIALNGVKIKKPYFYIVKPSKFANYGVNKMEKADELCINGSGGALASLFSVIDDTGINRACEFTMGGNAVNTAQAIVVYYEKPPVEVPTFNSNEVLDYLKKHKMFNNDITKVSYKWDNSTDRWFRKWREMTK